MITLKKSSNRESQKSYYFKIIFYMIIIKDKKETLGVAFWVFFLRYDQIIIKNQWKDLKIKFYYLKTEKLKKISEKTTIIGIFSTDKNSFSSYFLVVNFSKSHLVW